MAKRKQMVNPVDLIASINPFSTAAEQYRKKFVQILNFLQRTKKLNRWLLLHQDLQKENRRQRLI